MAGYLSKEWNGQRVAVRFARLVGDNAGGITVEAIKEEGAEAKPDHALRAFIPWAAVRYIRLLEEPGEASEG